MKKKSEAFALFKNLNFLKLWSGQIFSYLGDAIIQVILIACAVKYENNAGSEIAKVLFFFMIPSFLLSPLAGALSDRCSRKKLMALSSIYRTAVICALPFMSTHINPVTICGFSLLAGIGSAFYYPAKQSVLANVVKSEHLQVANAVNSGTGTIAILLGAVISGMSIEKIDITNSCFINGAVFFLSGLLAIVMNFTQASAIKQSKKHPMEDITFSLKYLKTHKVTRRVILLSLALALVTASFFNSLSAVATDYYKIGIHGLSLLKAMLGTGMILGTFVVLALNKHLRPSYMLAASFVAVFATTATAQAVTSYKMAWGWLIMMGIANAAIVITLDTILQKITPDRLRGKIFGFRSAVTSLAFLATTWFVSEFLMTSSPFQVFKFVSATSCAVAVAVLLFDGRFRHFLVRKLLARAFTTFFPVKVEGLEHVKPYGKMILAGNHTGWVDTLIIQTACKRPVWYITGPVAFQIPVIKWIINYFNVIPLQFGKGTKALDAAVNKLDKGEVVCIFPEGKLTTDGKLNKFNRGVAYMHKSGKAPIVPFVIQGGFEAWAYNKLIPTFRKITIQFGQPIFNYEADDKIIVQDLKDRVQFIKDSLDRREKAKRDPKFYGSVLDLMQMKSDVNAPVKALSLKDKSGWKELSYIELSRQAKNLSNYLIEYGIQREDRIAILSESRPEWGIAFFASIAAGAITVPLDIKLTLAELNSILSDCLPRVLCVSAHYLDTAKELKNLIPSIEQIFVIEEKPETCEYPSIYEVKGPDADMGRDRELDETALIVYTSGTTGNPKGVMITFGNIIAQLKDFEEVFDVDSNDSLVSILPLNHLLELNVGFLGMLHMGAQISYSKSLNPKEIGKIMHERRVTYMIAVPLFVKMLKGSVEKEIRKASKSTQSIFNFLYNAAKYCPIPVRRKLFSKIHAQFGGRMKGFVCGGAPLDENVSEFFERIGIPIYQGYGLTETSPTITTNTPAYNRIGSVGKPLPSVMVRLSEEGEILAKGPNLMKGYYNKPEMTHEVIDENGWFHTGDIGEFDKDGYLYITGRIKNMIVLGGGKKIFPEEVEAVLEKSPMIKELCVMSVKIQSGSKEGTEEVCAVVVPSDDMLKKCKDDAAGLQKEMETEVAKLAQDLASYKRPTVVAVHTEELPKTATKKVKRKPVQEWYYSQIQGLSSNV